MSQLEKRSTVSQRRAKTSQIILQCVGGAGLLAVTLVAPNVIGAMSKLGIIPKRRQGEYVAAARRQLKRDGLIVEEKGYLRLSEKGKRKLEWLSPTMLRGKPAAWDGKWRILIFDIPEKRRISRDAIRTRLRASGFVRAQDSVWIYPYACEDFVALLKAECRVGKDMLYLIVDTLEGDARFRKMFSLPQTDATPTIRVTGKAGAILDTILPESKYD